MLTRTSVVQKYGYKPNSGGDEHSALLAGIEKEGGCKRKEFGWMSSYAYNWATPLWRISGTLGSAPIGLRTEQWKLKNQDTGAGLNLNPDFTGMAGQLTALVADAPRTLPLPDVAKLEEALKDYL